MCMCVPVCACACACACDCVLLQLFRTWQDRSLLQEESHGLGVLRWHSILPRAEHSKTTKPYYFQIQSQVPKVLSSSLLSTLYQDNVGVRCVKRQPSSTHIPGGSFTFFLQFRLTRNFVLSQLCFATTSTSSTSPTSEMVILNSGLGTWTGCGDGDRGKASERLGGRRG